MDGMSPNTCAVAVGTSELVEDQEVEAGSFLLTLHMLDA